MNGKKIYNIGMDTIRTGVFCQTIVCKIDKICNFKLCQVANENNIWLCGVSCGV